jgi:hypothetical protein
LPDDIFSYGCRVDQPSRTSVKSGLESPDTVDDKSQTGFEKETANDLEFDDSASDSSDRVVRVKRPLASLFEEEGEPLHASACLHPDFIYDLEGFSDNSLKLFTERPVHRKCYSLT